MRHFPLPVKLAAAAVPLLAGAALTWAVTDAHAYNGRVLRNVTIAGHAIGGTNRAELDRVLDTVEEQLRATPVRVATTDGGFTAAGASFGITLDRPAIRAAAFEARRPKKTTDRLGDYFGSFFGTKKLAVPVHVSVTDTAKTLSANEGDKRRDPVDPQLKLRNGKFTTLPGSDGEGIDATALAEAIPAAIAPGKLPITIAANRVPLPSKFTTAELQGLVDRATALTANPIPFVVGDQHLQIEPAQLRAWVTPTIVNRHVQLVLDPDKTLAGIRALVGATVRKAENATLTVDASGTVFAVPSVDGLECCEPGTVERIQKAFSGQIATPVTLDLTVITPKVTTEEVTGLKVKEPIGSFTTKHKAGEDRVKNIHRIADLIRGQVILPGDTFSVNKFIGPRTEAKGFVEAHVIEDGVFKDSFGGGISQFATTLFNAAFFGGLDITAYKPHSLYISRYPFGREATLSYPYPDLKIHNNSPYGVMIWPTYTASTITVTLYSSAYAKGAVLDQKTSTQGECKVAVTTRIRTYTDGRTSQDKFKAVYMPSEGVDCNGNPTAGATTTTEKPTPGTAPTRTTVAGSGEAVTTTGRVTAGGSGEAGGSSTKPPKTTVVKPQRTEAPAGTSPPATAAPGDGGVVVARPPVTGVG